MTLFEKIVYTADWILQGFLLIAVIYASLFERRLRRAIMLSLCASILFAAFRISFMWFGEFAIPPAIVYFFIPVLVPINMLIIRGIKWLLVELWLWLSGLWERR